MRSIIHSLYCVTLGPLVWAVGRFFVSVRVTLASATGFVRGALGEIRRRRE